ncbi:BZ3500_MvSof-1268-A1-R1_Chr2-3g05365 [Microbotryum saponariae]|uniref:HECT-type E3 ubiquitin transferase n=1 Tax=Microbotryum saponariae TaxID=289078 RepID=A0A2X0K703_9BASI|nr:BZ3500_MvSof-1268-A1-R1_Chr2-3g05365 [Microbotryum saponariae]SDA01289.1 BZ3501_MvSof-1269-A2-R1_Chr2-2g05038 [Microbotryum saponariae]
MSLRRSTRRHQHPDSEPDSHSSPSATAATSFFDAPRDQGEVALTDPTTTTTATRSTSAFSLAKVDMTVDGVPAEAHTPYACHHRRVLLKPHPSHASLHLTQPSLLLKSSALASSVASHNSSTSSSSAPTTEETRSTTTATTTSQASTVDGPSAKALGKRRAVSPPLAVEADSAATVKTRARSSKRRKVNRSRSPASKDSTKGRAAKISSTKSEKKALRRSRRSLTNPATKAGAEAGDNEEMPRKGSRTRRAAKAKARAAENDDEDLLGRDDVDMAIDHDEEERDESVAGTSTSPSSSSRRKKEAMKASTSVGSSSGKRWGGPQMGKQASGTGKATTSKAELSPKTSVKGLGKGSMGAQEPTITVDPVDPLEDDPHGQEVDEEDDDDDDDDGEEDSEDDDAEEDDDDQYDDDDLDEEEIDDYETTLGADGRVFDEEGYSSGGGESELHDPPQTFDADGSPLDEAGSAVDRAAAEAAAATADAVFFGGIGGAFRAQMAEASARMKRLLGSLKSKKGDADAKIMALQELAELLSISTEDTLAGGYFQTEQFVKELVSILRGDSNGGRSSSSGLGAGGMTMEEMIAFGIEPSESMGAGGGGGDTTENDVQMMLLACRCLANLMEALPGSSHSVVYAGAVPVLCSKLQEIQYIELAEQTLSTLEKISEEMPSSIVREGGLAALLNFLDFFSFHVQRTAVTAAANCCRSVSLESFSMVKDVMPIFKQTLGYPDQRLVEQSCLAVVRIVESYRYYPEKLEDLLSADLLSAVRVLLNPDCTTVGAGTYTQTLKMLATAAKASPGVAATLVDLNLGQTIYHLLTGVAAPEFTNDEGVQVLSKTKAGEDDMLVMQNLVQRPKEQIQETLTLVCELLPPLPKDGIFDPKAYTQKNSSRSKAKQRNVVERAASSSSLVDVKMEAMDDDTTMAFAAGSSTSAPSSSRLSASTSMSSSGKHAVPKDANTVQRLESIEDPTRQVVLRRFYALLLPILVDVCAASVNPQVRTKAVLGLCKIIHFCDTENLAEILHTVSMASFLAAILSSRDQTPLRLLALQLVDLLLVKMPDAYQYFFRREGVMHELEQIAASPILVPPKSKHASPARTPKEEPGVSSSSNAPSGLWRALAQHASSSSAASTTTAGTTPTSLLSTAEMQGQDLITYRARHLRNEYGSTESESAVRAQQALENLRLLVKELDAFTASSSSGSPPRASPRSVSKHEAEITRVLSRVASHFVDELTALSSFELQESGLVEGLLRFATAETGLVDKRRRHDLFVDAFVRSDVETPAFALLVKRLQETLSRMEEFEVLLASSNATDGECEHTVSWELSHRALVLILGDLRTAESRRNGPAMLARQLKLRLVAEDGSDVPRSCSNIVVSIHAIATFQAFNDYLRPRIVAATTLSDRLGLANASTSAPASGAGTGNGANRLSGFLAAFAAANGISPPSSPVPAASTSQSTSAMASGSANRLSSSLGNNASASTSTNNPLAGSANAVSTPKSKATAPPIGHRRSRRLSGKGVDTSEAAAGEAADQEMRDASKDDELCIDNPSAEGAEEHTEEEKETDHDDDENEEDDEDDNEDEQGAFPDELDPVAAPRDERPVNLEVADDGSKVIAKTPDGTRVATPTLGNSASTPRATPTTSQAPKPRASYAAAVKSEPTDFHLAFSVGGRDVGHDTTIFGAIHAIEVANSGTASSEVPRNLWHAIHEVRFRRVAGPPRPEAALQSLAQQSFTHDSIMTDMPASVPRQSRQAKILQLLWVLHQLNSDCFETVEDGRSALPEVAFVNNKLTAKLNRQLEEPMIVASACLPAWATDLPQAFPFLFPFDTRFVFLQSTAFGYARLVQKWVVQARSESSRRDENLGLLARVNRQKVRIARDRVLESTHKVFELYGSSRAALEVEFFDEVGSGLGPTLEFYALASKEFARKNLRLWRDNDGHDDASSTYVHSPTGLFPRPIKDTISDSNAKVLKHFRVLGQFVAKAMMDSRIIDVHFSRSFMKLVLDQELPLAIASVRVSDWGLEKAFIVQCADVFHFPFARVLQSIDRGLAKSLSILQDFVDARRAILDDDTKSEVEQQSAIEAITVHGSSIVDLALDFTLPGYDIALKPEGDSISVTADNVEEYISLVLEWTLRRGVASQVSEFQTGFSAVFPVRDMQSFTPSELVMMTSALQEDWSIEGLTSATKADHGFTMDSRPVRDLLSVMSELSLEDRRVFLSFITGSPRLPIGGFAALSPTLTIVRKDGGDPSLPSVMTCVNYFKLPDYTSRQIVKERIMTAIREGGGGFHLS